MSTERGILTLTQWLSPAFPVGAFAYSHGLETAVHQGDIQGEGDLASWLGTVLTDGSGRNDCILLQVAHRASGPDELERINDTALAFAASRERQREAQLQGAAFCETSAAIWGGGARAYVYPVAVGQAAARARIDPVLTAMVFAQAFVGNLVSAAQRMMPLGQTRAQGILADLLPQCEEVAISTADAGLDDLCSTAFVSDIAAMRHETLQPRIFRS